MSFIDPTTLCVNERETLSKIIASDTAAQTAVVTVLAEFQELIAKEITSEKTFESDLENLAATYSAINLEATIDKLNVTSSNIDAAYLQLQDLIVKNNATASNILASIKEGSKLASKIESSQNDILLKCSKYTKAICCFRDFADDFDKK